MCVCVVGRGGGGGKISGYQHELSTYNPSNTEINIPLHKGHGGNVNLVVDHSWSMKLLYIARQHGFKEILFF